MAVLNDTIPSWEAETVGRRMERSRAMLYLHGLLTETENQRVKERIGKLMVNEHVAGTEPALGA